MSKPKIAILISSLQGGGSERTVSHLLDGLAAIYEVHLILFRDEIEYELPPGQIVKVLLPDSGSGGHLSNILELRTISKRLRAYCESRDIELILSFLSRPNFAACFAKRGGMRAKVLVSERTYTPEFHRRAGFAGVLSSRLVRWLYPYADEVLPNSEGTLEALRRVYGLKNVRRTVRNLLDLERIRDLASEPIDRRPEGFTYMHLGSFTFMKGQRMILEAFAALEDKDSQLMFAGVGKLEEDVRRRAADLGLTGRVTFLGHLKNPFRYLAAADCFVFGSDFEGFPNAMLEAIACGLPVVSTDCLTGPREILHARAGGAEPVKNATACDCGILVPLNDPVTMSAAMQRMQEDGPFREACAAAAIERSKDYDKPKIIEEFIEIVDEYLDEK